MSRLLVVLLDARRTGERRDVDARERPPARERAAPPAKVGDLLRADLSVRGRGGDADEVLEELGARLLLEGERELHGAVQEVRDDLHVLLGHVARGERGGAEADSAGDLGRS